MLFTYKAINKKGKKVKGVVEYETRREAFDQLKTAGLRVTDIKVKKESRIVTFFKKLNMNLSSNYLKLFGGKLKKRQFDSFKEELEFLGYDKLDINSMLRGVQPKNFNIDNFKNQLDLSDIQIEKIRSGKLNKNSEDNKINVFDDKKKIKINFGVSLTELILFTEQLSILLDTNVEIIESLETIQRNLRSKKLKSIIDSIIYDLTKGREFSEALQAHENVFPPLYVSMVKVGEQTGSQLSRALNDIAMFLKMRLKLKKEITKACIYPSFIVVAMFGILIFMNYFLVPKMRTMFESMDFEMPVLTRIVFSLSENLGIFIFGLVLLTFIAILCVWKIDYIRIRAKDFFDFISLKIPVLKSATLTTLMYQLTLTMTITLRNGISITDSLDLVSNILGNKFLKRDIGDIYYSLEKGKEISQAFSEKENITDIVKVAITSGDKSGKLDETLDRVSKYYSEEMEAKLAAFIQFIIPISIILLTLLIAPFIISVYLPIASMTDQLGRLK